MRGCAIRSLGIGKEGVISVRCEAMGYLYINYWYENITINMLIPRDKLEEIFRHFGVTIKGVLHVGAHNCEERS